MKKILSILFVFVLVVGLVACGGEVDPTPTPQPTPEPMPEVESEYEPEPEPEPREHPSSLGITLDQVFDTVEWPSSKFSETFYRTFDLTDGMQVTTRISSGGTSNRMFLYHSEDGYISTVLLDMSYRTTNITDTEAAHEKIMDLLPPEVFPGHDFVVFGNAVFGERRIFVVTLSSEHELDFDFGTLVFSSKERALTDFFSSDENIEQYTQLLQVGDFAGLYNLVTAHIENNDAQAYDSAWIILNYLEPMLAHFDRITVEYDAFDSVATIFYRGLTDVSLNHSFVPYTTAQSDNLRIVVGFHNNGWVFANHARVRLENGETINVSMDGSANDVIRGGEIREFIRWTPFDRDIERLLESPVYMIRFEGSERELDRTMTQSEQEALEVVYAFRYTPVFRHLLSRWRDAQ